MKFNISLVEIINTAIKIKVLKHLMLHESPMSEREIASVVKVSHMSVNRVLKELAGHNLVTFVTTGKAHLWKINKASYAFSALSAVIKEIASLDTPLSNLRNTIKHSLPLKLVKKAVLFGSVAKGSEEPDSDIDLFILVKDNGDKQRVMEAVGDLSNKCLDLYGNKLSAYILTLRESGEKKNTNILQEVEKGIKIIQN